MNMMICQVRVSSMRFILYFKHLFLHSLLDAVSTAGGLIEIANYVSKSSPKRTELQIEECYAESNLAMDIFEGKLIMNTLFSIICIIQLILQKT